MRVVASIEARMSSSRLPGKSIKKILDKPMLELMIERVKDCKEVDDIIIATSSNKTDDVIAELASRLNVNNNIADTAAKRVFFILFILYLLA